MHLLFLQQGCLLLGSLNLVPGDQIVLHYVEHQVVLLEELDVKADALERISSLLSLFVDRKDLVFAVSLHHYQPIGARLLELLHQSLDKVLGGFLEVPSDVETNSNSIVALLLIGLEEHRDQLRIGFVGVPKLLKRHLLLLLGDHVPPGLEQLEQVLVDLELLDVVNFSHIEIELPIRANTL